MTTAATIRFASSPTMPTQIVALVSKPKWDSGYALPPKCAWLVFGFGICHSM